MLIVKIELHPSTGGRPKEIGRMLIINDGTGTIKRGNYDARVMRRGSRDFLDTIREGRVTNYPRMSYNVWRLVARCLKACFHEENKPNG